MQPTSPRIARLRDALAVSQAEEVERFWGEISSGGSPLIERIDGDNREYLATFVWRATYKIQNVLVLWPGRAESDHYMTHIPGTDIWYRTVQLVAGSRFSYQLAPNDAGRLPHFSAQHDPFNQHSILARSASVLELPGAPDGSSYLRPPRLRGAVAKHQIESRVLKGRREVSIYTPPAYASGAGPYALLLLFDGLAYEQQPPHLVSEEDDHMRIGAPVILDNLIGDQRIRPTVACLVNYGPDGTRADLGNPSYPDFIATELLPWIRARYAVSVNARDVVIGGYSAGGGAAGAIALKYPDLFGNVLLQSAGGPRLTPLILANARQPIRFYQEGGIYEFVAGGSGPLFPGELALRESTVPSVFVQRRLHDVLRAKGYDVTYVETGTAHEDLHWRATLPDALVGLLGTQPN